MSADDPDLCQLRAMTEHDLALVLQWRNHDEIRRYMYSQQPISPEEHRQWFERTSVDSKRHLLIFEVESCAMGFVNFNQLGSGGVLDWGFYVAPDAPKGTGRRLGKAALDYAFTTLKQHKVCAEALAYNSRSVEFHKRLGFLQEGFLRDQYFDGQNYHAVIRFGLLSHEWNPGN